ncbi:hypothetical protein [Salegentibacter maritimus]|uniref:PKD domain-containing protein n=1 Tax=Salegentibacter maritimus TaxID=2794347 RepID=A0ABS0TGC1_9FLAO|nr:hypothetical protein [Salegentibacter maritimus]MBI6120104.1 hypothetical protein [Salegentibacter maritimus]
MKTYINKHILLLLSFIVFMVSCTPDEDSKSVFADDELPKIFFVNWSASQSINANGTLIHSPVVSPNDGAIYEWTLESETISEEKDLNYIVTETPGVYTLTFTVTRNGISTYRTTELTVN